MKKVYFLWVLLVLILSACSFSSTNTPVNSTGSDMPGETQLAVGTLKLAGTEQDITSEQAQALVVLWQVYRELGESDIAAQAEVDGLIVQIQESMTTEQMEAITEMQITQKDVSTAMQGIAVASNDTAGDTVSLPSSGGMPAGASPSDSGAPPEGGMPPDMSGVAPASSVDASQSVQAGTQSITDVPTGLVETVIQSLQQKITG